jgi:transposase
MRDKDLYAQILGIRYPWFVSEVELQLQEEEVIVHLEVDPDYRLTCPVCGKASPGYDTRRRCWRHLDTCQYRTVLVADVPRVECEEHGVHQIDVPWSERGARFTALFEALAIDWMKEASLSAVRRLLGISWDEAAGIQERAVRRGVERREAVSPKRIGVDETSFQKGHEYVTVVSDQESANVLYVADDRKQGSLDGFYSDLSEAQRGEIESVSMDMWAPYIASTQAYVPGAEEKIAFDKFHVAKHLGEAVDKVRRREHKALAEQGCDDLKGTRYLWLRKAEKLSPQRWAELKVLRRRTLKTAEAWAVKEMAMSLWGYKTRTWARKAWQQCLQWAKMTDLGPVISVARMLERHLEGILNAIVLKATNALAEGINSRIQWIKKMACGFRNRERFRQAILFHLGGLDLYPASLKRS